MLNSDKHKVLIVENDPRSAYMIAVYSEKYGCTVIEQLPRTGAMAISLAKKMKPDLIFMDINIRGEIDGIETAELINRDIDTSLVFVTNNNDQRTLVRTRRVRPKWFINKPLREEDFRACLSLAFFDGVAAQDTSSRYSTQKTSNPKQLKQAVRNFYRLTPAEARVVMALLLNPRTEMMAQLLHISRETVQTHLRNIYRKTGTSGRAFLVYDLTTGPFAEMILNYAENFGMRRSLDGVPCISSTDL